MTKLIVAFCNFAIAPNKKRRTADWNCHILRRNCLLKQVVEGKVEGM
jgi:hypothetical protein